MHTTYLSFAPPKDKRHLIQTLSQNKTGALLVESKHAWLLENEASAAGLGKNRWFVTDELVELEK